MPLRPSRIQAGSGQDQVWRLRTHYGQGPGEGADGAARIEVGIVQAYHVTHTQVAPAHSLVVLGGGVEPRYRPTCGGRVGGVERGSGGLVHYMLCSSWVVIYPELDGRQAIPY